MVQVVIAQAIQRSAILIGDASETTTGGGHDGTSLLARFLKRRCEPCRNFPRRARSRKLGMQRE